MATKKECDRCGKQWVPETPNRYSDNDTGDMQLGTVTVSIPEDTSKYGKPRVNKTYELCQPCSRHINDALQPQPKAE